MPAALDHVVDLIFGRWRSQILHAGTALDIFDHLKLGQDRPALSVASEINADLSMLYRLFTASCEPSRQLGWLRKTMKTDFV